MSYFICAALVTLAIQEVLIFLGYKERHARNFVIIAVLSVLTAGWIALHLGQAVTAGEIVTSAIPGSTRPAFVLDPMMFGRAVPYFFWHLPAAAVQGVLCALLLKVKTRLAAGIYGGVMSLICWVVLFLLSGAICALIG